MSERKVLNKYYPPDFDPCKIPRVKCPKNRQFTVRLMAPFNMRCKTCGEYIYKGKKFNARKEDVDGEDYLGIRIFRFYIKCTRCLQEISFKTDPKNTDYEIEAGATRNFMALKLAEEQAEREEEERKEEEASNPMKVLENRTQQSKHELELLETLEELKDLNKRQQSIDYNLLLNQYNTRDIKEKIIKLQEEEDELLIKRTFGEKRVVEEVIIKENKRQKTDTEPIISTPSSSTSNIPNTTSKNNSYSKSVGSFKRNLSSLVKIKKKESDSNSDTIISNSDLNKDSNNDNINTDLSNSSNINKSILSNNSDNVIGKPDSSKGIDSDVNSGNKNEESKTIKSALSLLNSYSDSEDDNSD